MKKLDLQRCVLGMVSTNCYFVKNTETGELFLVDPADNAEAIDRKIKEMGGTLTAILLTHGHYDHILAANEVKEAYHVPIYACAKETELLQDPGMNLSGYCHRACSIQPDVCLVDLEVFETAGFSIQVIHTPGHTPGSCCYYLEAEGVLFSGDTLFCRSVGRTDLPGGSSGEIIESLHRLLNSLPEETEVYPGHDIATNILYEKRYNPFV